MRRRAADGSREIGGMVLAAGAGERFGSPKQLAEFRGRPLLEHALIALARAELNPAVVVLGSASARVLEEVPLHGIEPVVCGSWRHGPAASLCAGIAALGTVDAAVVLLGDQPLVPTDAISRVIASRDRDAVAVRATYGGAPGHPVLLERPALRAAKRLRGQRGARVLLERGGVRAVPCDDLGSDADVDRPEDLAALEACSKAIL